MNARKLAAIATVLLCLTSPGCNIMQRANVRMTHSFQGRQMSHVTVQRTVNAPVEQVFSTWNDEFGDVYKFNPNLSSSHLLEDTPASSGLGATRQCNLNDGKNWLREKVIAFEPNRRMVIDIYEGTMPLKTAIASIDFSPMGQNQTLVQMTMEFEPKMGLVGKAMVPMMKMKFRPMLQAFLDANADYVERGVQVNHELALSER